MVEYIRCKGNFFDTIRALLESVDSEPIVLRGGKLATASGFIRAAYANQSYETTIGFVGSYRDWPKELKHPLARIYAVSALVGSPDNKPRPVEGLEALLAFLQIDPSEHEGLVVVMSKRGGVVILKRVIWRITTQ
jgi:hypothetical protein